tara:strand:+ start:502 stop:1227 length:726 start_codon:yes stop_codon:yes gene_type:complete
MVLTEVKLRKIIRSVLNEKKFSQLAQYAKNKEMQIYDDLMDSENDALRDEVFDLIDRSYAYLDGNADIRTADDLANKSQNDYSTFLAWDIDADPEPDVLRGMKPKAGKMKLTLSATDGTEVAGSYVVGDTASRLSDGQHYAEMSGRAATSQMKQATPAVTDEATVRALLPGKEITWFGVHPALYDGNDPVLMSVAADFKGDPGEMIAATKAKQYGPEGQYDGWYVRMLGGSPHAKLIFGAV